MKRIIGKIFSNSNDSNYYGARSFSAPKPKLPPRLNKSYKQVISLKYAIGFNWNNIEIITLDSYKQFFEFYVTHNEEGCIFDVEVCKGED